MVFSHICIKVNLAYTTCQQRWYCLRRTRCLTYRRHTSSTQWKCEHSLWLPRIENTDMLLIVSYPILSYLILSCLVLSCLVLSCLVLSCLVLSFLAFPYLALPCLALPCLALPCLALPCLALPYLTLPYDLWYSQLGQCRLFIQQLKNWEWRTGGEM